MGTYNISSLQPIRNRRVLLELAVFRDESTHLLLDRDSAFGDTRTKAMQIASQCIDGRMLERNVQSELLPLSVQRLHKNRSQLRSLQRIHPEGKEVCVVGQRLAFFQW